MKLLLDQNISYRLVARLSVEYPDTTYIRFLGMEGANDATIWRFAHQEGYGIVTHDADFSGLSALTPGRAPLVVWLRCGNQPKSVILKKLLEHRGEIERAGADSARWRVEIY